MSRTKARMELNQTTLGDGIKLRSLLLDARPGIPLCDKCHTPLDVQVEKRGRLKASCLSCNDEAATYEVDEKALQKDALVGALGDDHRTDRSNAKMSSAQPGSAVAIQCPGCGASLDLSAKDHFVTCKYCNVASKIPSRLRSQLFAENVDIEPFWLLFAGPSPARAKLLNKARAAENKAKKQQAKAADRARQQSVQQSAPRGGAAKPYKPIGADPSSQLARNKRAMKRVYISFGIGVPVFMVVWYFTSWRPLQEENAASETRRAAQVKAREEQHHAALEERRAQTEAKKKKKAEANRPKSREEHVALKGCGCDVTVGGKRQTIALASRGDVTATMNMGGVQKSFFAASYFLDVGDNSTRLTTAQGDVPPPSVEGMGFELAMGCANDTVAMVGAQSATGWSIDSDGGAHKVWSTPLPGAANVRNGAGDLTIMCSKSTTAGGVMTIADPPGTASTPLRIKIADGAVL